MDRDYGGYGYDYDYEDDLEYDRRYQGPPAALCLARSRP